MSNWTHINCCVRGEFDRAKLVELFGEPTIRWCELNKYKYGTAEYKELQEKVIESHKQSKLPYGEEPLHWELYTPNQTGGSCYSIDEGILTITGDLRSFDMNEQGFAEIEKICLDLLETFDYGVRQLTMQAYEEFSGKEWIWSSVFNCKLKLNVWEPDDEN